MYFFRSLQFSKEWNIVWCKPEGSKVLQEAVFAASVTLHYGHVRINAKNRHYLFGE